MNAFNKALRGLKDTYPSPDAEREQAFLDRIAEEHPKQLHAIKLQKRTVLYTLPAIAAAAVMIMVGISVYQKAAQNKIPTLVLPDETTTATVEESVDIIAGISTGSEDKDDGVMPLSPTDPQESPSEVSAEEQGSTVPLSGTTAENAATSPAATATQPAHTDAAKETRMPTQTQQAVNAETRSVAQTTAERTSYTQPSEVKTETDEAGGTELSTSPHQTEPADNEPVPDVPLPNDDDHQQDPAPITAGIDKRVKPLYDYQRGMNVTSIDDLHHSGTPMCEEPVMPAQNTANLEMMIKQSDLIILAWVEDKYFTQADQTAYTQLDLLIETVFKGDCNSDDRISVYEPGGYLPLEVAAEMDPSIAELAPDADSIYYPGNGTAVGQEYVMFLSRSSPSRYPEGTYIYSGQDSICCLRKCSWNEYRSVNGALTLSLNDLAALQ